MPVNLKSITKGKQEREPRVLIYGADGVGKTKYAAGAPDPFVIDVNRGSFAYDVNRVTPDSWTEVTEWVEAVEKGLVKCKTLVLDSISDLEHMGNLEFFGGITIDKYDGGYGRGNTVAVTKWRELLAGLERVWNTGKGIVLTGHMHVKHFDDPTGPGYDRFQLAARDGVAGLVRQWSDFVLFAREDVSQQKVGGDTKAVTNGTRWLYTRRTPSYDAKSRGSTMFPDKIPLSWDDFARARSADAERVIALQKEIEDILATLSDKALETQVRDYLRAQPDKIVEARNSLAARLEKKQTESKTTTAATTAAGETK